MEALELDRNTVFRDSGLSGSGVLSQMDIPTGSNGFSGSVTRIRSGQPCPLVQAARSFCRNGYLDDLTRPHG